MLFSKPKNTDAPAPARRSTMNILLNPEFGKSARPIGESTRVFVNLIAMLFAMNGLFPKDHPAFAKNTTVHLSLPDVIATAWGNLSFTEPNIPRILFFFAVIGSMVITTLAAVIGLFSLFVGTAHAQTSQFFTPPAGDLAQNWIDFMFNGGQLDPNYKQDGSAYVPTSQTYSLQCSLMTALGFYSDAVLLIAAMILFYHLAAMVVETAHHGVVMGKRANQVWAPIRLVVAVGLLVPINGTPMSTCTSGGTGLNSAQYITIKIAELGSALASNTWNKFLTTMGDTKYNLVTPPIPVLDGIVFGIMKAEACEAIWNHLLADGTSYGPDYSQEQINDPSSNPEQDQGGDWFYDYSPLAIADKGLCGSITLPGLSQVQTYIANEDGDNSPLQQSVNPTTAADAVAKAQITAAQDIIKEIHGLFTPDNNPITPFYTPWNAKTNNDGLPPANTIFSTEVTHYATELKQLIDSALQGQTTSPGVISAQGQSTMSSIGWIGAGAWANTIARDQGSVINVINDNLPKIEPPGWGNEREQINENTKDTVNAFSVWLQNGFPQGTTATSPCALEGAAGTAGLRKKADASSPTLAALKAIDALAVEQHVWLDESNGTNGVTCPNQNASFSLGQQFTSPNPLGELTAFGYKSLHVALKASDFMIYGILAQGAGEFLKGASAEYNDKFDREVAAGNAESGSILKTLASTGGLIGGAISGAGALATTVFGFVAVIFLTIGVTLGFIVPLIPFVHFFFGAVAWGLVLLEAIIAMPLVALAHLNPEGDGLPGGMAKQAYFMLLGLFMRPVLMIFGLIASLLIFFLAMFLLNKLFALTVVGTNGLNQGFSTFARMVYTFIYVFLAYTCAVNCFKIVDSIPESVFRWININIQHQRIADGGSTLQTAGPIATGVITQQAMTSIQGMAGPVGNIARDAGKAGGGVPPVPEKSVPTSTPKK